MNKSNIYITQNLKELEKMRIEDLVQLKIWRTEKGNKYKYQKFDTMSDEHLQNAINIFMRTNNHIVLEALSEELARRIKLAEIIKQKIKQMTNTSNNTDTQTQFDFAENQNTLNEAASVAETLQPTETVENYMKAEFVKGQVVKEYTILDIISTNHRGYTLTVKKEGEEFPFNIAQSKFKEKIGIRKYKKKSKKKLSKKAVSKEKIVFSKKNVVVYPQKYEIGYLVGNCEILDVRKNNRGITRGYGYFIKNANGKKYWVKQSQLRGEVIKKSKPTPTVDDYAAKEVTETANNNRVDIQKEIKNMSFFNRLKMLFT